MKDVAGYTNHGSPRSFGIPHSETLADRIFSGPETASHRFVDERYPRGGCNISLIELTPAQYGNSHRPQVAWRDRIAVRAGIFFGVWQGLAFDVNAVHVQIPTERELANNSGRFDAGKRLNFLENLVEKCNRRRVFGFGSPESDGECQSVGRIETRFDFEQTDETFHHQAGTGQKEQRQSNVRKNERTAQTVAFSASGSFAGFLQ